MIGLVEERLLKCLYALQTFYAKIIPPVRVGQMRKIIIISHNKHRVSGSHFTIRLLAGPHCGAGYLVIRDDSELN